MGRPTQILDHQQDRAAAAQLLDQRGGRLHNPELDLRCLTEPAPVDTGARVVPVQPGDRRSPAVGGPTAQDQTVADRPEWPSLFQLVGGAPEDLKAPCDRSRSALGDHAGLPDPGLADHQECLADPTSDLAHRRPKLLELGGATDQTALRAGTDVPRHRDASRNRLPVDGAHVTEPCSSAPSQTIRHLADASQS
jgi:hypothetical protein